MLYIFLKKKKLHEFYKFSLPAKSADVSFPCSHELFEVLLYVEVSSGHVVSLYLDHPRSVCRAIKTFKWLSAPGQWNGSEGETCETKDVLFGGSLVFCAHFQATVTDFRSILISCARGYVARRLRGGKRTS